MGMSEGLNELNTKIIDGAGIAGLLAVAGVGAASWLWEAWVPLDAREAIDAWLVGPPPELASGSLANMPGVTR